MLPTPISERLRRLHWLLAAGMGNCADLLFLTLIPTPVALPSASARPTVHGMLCSTKKAPNYFAKLCAGRSGGELILRQSNGKPWGPGRQFYHMRITCGRAKIDPPMGFHQLRHTWASHAVMNGAPLLVVARNLGHARHRMVEAALRAPVGRLRGGCIRNAAPTFGMVEPINVIPISPKNFPKHK